MPICCSWLLARAWLSPQDFWGSIRWKINPTSGRNLLKVSRFLGRGFGQPMKNNAREIGGRSRGWLVGRYAITAMRVTAGGDEGPAFSNVGGLFVEHHQGTNDPVAGF